LASLLSVPKFFGGRGKGKKEKWVARRRKEGGGEKKKKKEGKRRNRQVGKT